MDRSSFVGFPENYEDLCREQGDKVSVIPRGADVNVRDIALIVKKIDEILDELINVVRETDIDYQSILSLFLHKICDVDHLYKNKSNLNMLIGALNTSPLAYRQVWVSIMCILSNRIVPFSAIPSLDVSQKFSRSRKCPSLVRNEEGHTIFYRPQFVSGDSSLFELLATLVPCDEEITVEGKVFEMPSSSQWYVVMDEFNIMMQNGIISYREGDKSTIHNLLVGMALKKYPLAKKMPYQALVKTLGAQIKPNLSIDEQNLLELINSILSLTNFEIGSKSLIDAPYIIDKALPTVIYRANENGKSVRKVRQYQPYGWHKVPERRSDRSGTRMLPDYATITVLARDCAVAWNGILSDLSKIKIDERSLQIMNRNVRSWISISQRIRKEWYTSQSSKVIEKLNIIKRATKVLPSIIATDQINISSAEKGDFTLLSKMCLSPNSDN